MNRVLKAEGWGFTVEIDGNDFLLKGGSSCFGGDGDSGDNGETACGFPTKGHPDLLGCALPMRVDSLVSLSGSPLPHLPFGLFSNGTDNPHGAHCDITFPSGLQVKGVPVIDLGPARSANRVIDLSVAVARKFDPAATANNYNNADVLVRVVNGALMAGVAETAEPAPVAPVPVSTVEDACRILIEHSKKYAQVREKFDALISELDLPGLEKYAVNSQARVRQFLEQLPDTGSVQQPKA